VQLRDWIAGRRNVESNWCDWDIPLHWGAMSDPFQPCELQHRRSFECLKIFAETQYPFIFSSKGALLLRPDYQELLSKCNVVAQISMVAPAYDAIEPGAPPFAARLRIVQALVPITKRVIVRMQPFDPKYTDEVLSVTIPALADSGAHGVVIEGWKFFSLQQNTYKLAGDVVFDLDYLAPAIQKIGAAVRAIGLKFYVGENRLRFLGDNVCCCGVADLPGFKPNKANLNHLLAGDYEATQAQCEKKTGGVFAVLGQTAPAHAMARPLSFNSLMQAMGQTYSMLKLMGVEPPEPQPDLFGNKPA
jgi:hypothetical protein